MTAPRLEIHLGHLHHNAATLVRRLGREGIGITGVSKGVLAKPEIVHTWQAAGVTSIGESRIEPIEALKRQGITAPRLLIRTPMLSQVERVVAHAAISCNSEAVVLRALAVAARGQGRCHGVVLMVELGDLREGILPGDLDSLAQLTLELPSLRLEGIGSNLGCQHGVAPDGVNTACSPPWPKASKGRFGIHLNRVSGGNSANLPWLSRGDDRGRINHLRLGPPPGVAIVGASSVHLVVESVHDLRVGEELEFRPGYSALMRATTSPFVARRCSGGSPDQAREMRAPRAWMEPTHRPWA